MLGRFLFRWRGVIGLAAFGVTFWLARPTTGSCSAGLVFLLAGLAVRFWASGYIGIEGRAREIGASLRVVSGPYRLLRHPLYVGNFLLVAGMLVALRPGIAVGVAVMVGFIVEYTLIVVAEERELSSKWKVESGNDKGAGEEKAQADVRSQKLEARMQNAELQMAVSGRREAEGESFSPRRAMCEWRTWLAIGVAFGLAILKAALRAR